MIGSDFPNLRAVQPCCNRWRNPNGGLLLGEPGQPWRKIGLRPNQA